MEFRSVRRVFVVTLMLSIGLIFSYWLLVMYVLGDGISQLEAFAAANPQFAQSISSGLREMNYAHSLIFFSCIGMVLIFVFALYVNRLLKRAAFSHQWKLQAKRFSNIVSVLPVATFVVDDMHRVIMANCAASDLLKMPKGKFIGNSIFSFINLCPSVFQSDEEHHVVENVKVNDQLSISIDVTVQHLDVEEGRMYLVAVNNISEFVKDRVTLIQQRDEFKQIACQDPLTHIANRRRFEEFFEDSHAKAERNETPLSLLIIDIDYFKQFNDIYGHSAGDMALKSVANTLKGNFQRRSDLCARIGGEEFACLLNDSNLKDATRMAELICRQIQDLEISHKGCSHAKHITVSIGLVSYYPEQEKYTCTQLFEQADRALYQSKSKGRNRVTVYQPFEQLELDNITPDDDVVLEQTG